MKKGIICAFIISFSLLFISYIPHIYEATLVNQVPHDRIMIWGEHVYTYDYNTYLSKIRQGKEKCWSIVDKYDNNSHQKGAFLQMLYLTIGKVGGIFNLSNVLIFHLAKTIFCFLWIITIIVINVYFLKKPKIYLLGIILSLLATSFPIITTMGNKEIWISYHMSWWQEMDILKRINYLPHYTLNYIFLALLVMLASKLSIEKRNQYFLIMGGIFFISLFIHPAGGIVFFIAWILYHILRIIIYRDLPKNEIITIASQSLVFLILLLIPLLYISRITSTYPWKSLTDFDQYNRISVPLKEYILSLGPVFFTGISGILYALIKRKTDLLFLACWFIGAFMALITFKLLPFQSELRFVQTANHIPLAILTAYFFEDLIINTKNLLIKIIVYVFTGIIIAFGILQIIFSLQGQILFTTQKALADYPLVASPPQVVQPLKDFYSGLIWLENNTDRSSIVLSKVTAGNYIPAYSGNFVYLGHGGETPHFDERTTKAVHFFSGELSESLARDFVKKEHIDYVFYGPQEKESTTSQFKYSFLTPVFLTPYVTIYRVIK